MYIDWNKYEFNCSRFGTKPISQFSIRVLRDRDSGNSSCDPFIDLYVCHL